MPLWSYGKKQSPECTFNAYTCLRINGYIMKKLFLFLLLLLTCSTGLYGEEFPQINGWSVNGDIITYDPGNLWEYIDGAANQYLAYDFKLLKLRELQKGDIILTVEIYDMGNSINAFGIYTSERPDDADLIKIGTEAVVIPPYHALMLKDRFYVKVVIQQGELDQEKGEDILKDVAFYLPGRTDFPPALKLLSEKGRIPGTIKYIAKGYLGLSEINNLVYADYRDSRGNEFRSFVMIFPDKVTVKETWKILTDKWQSETQNGRTVLYRKVPYEGLIGVVKTDDLIKGVSGVEEKAELFKVLLKN
jgi:hypothetical protein